MNESRPDTTFRGLPLTPEQDSEVRHYIHVRSRCGMAWDTPELQAMLRDMLAPPEMDDEDGLSYGASTVAEHSAAVAHSSLDLEAPPDDRRH